MNRLFELRRDVNQFVQRLNSLLNRTVCDGASLNAVLLKNAAHFSVGNGVTKGTPTSRVGIPLRTGRRKASGYLQVCHKLGLDAEGQHMMTLSSHVGLVADEEGKKMLLHFDYERDKGDGYPEAHLQVYGGHAHWREWLDNRGVDRQVQRLHIPVGGRRFRPILEDAVEFLIVERLADGRPGWRLAIAEGRERFHRMQLGAAVRRDPATARAALDECMVA